MYIDENNGLAVNSVLDIPKSIKLAVALILLDMTISILLLMNYLIDEPISNAIDVIALSITIICFTGTLYFPYKIYRGSSWPRYVLAGLVTISALLFSGDALNATYDIFFFVEFASYFLAAFYTYLLFSVESAIWFRCHS